MTSTYNTSGITVDRYADILARLITLAGDWSTDEDKFYGHIIRVLATLLGESNEVLQSIYDGFKVSNATGSNLDALMELIGLTRSAAAYSTATLTLTATDATTVPAGSRYATSGEVIFATDSDLVFTGAGSDDVTATCTVVGANEAAIGTITTIKTAVYGISACTNAAAATPGRIRETDASLKERHTTAVSTSGDQDTASIYEAVTAVTGVSSCYVKDNATSAAVTMDGYSIPAYTVHVSAIGGDQDDIATAIANNIPSGVPTYGSTTVSVYNTTTKQNKDINFTVASNTSVYITVGYTPVDGVFPENGEELMEDYLIEYFSDFDIADDVVYTALYKPIYTVPGVIVDTLYIDTSPSPVATSDITINANKLAVVSSTTIVIAETP